MQGKKASRMKQRLAKNAPKGTADAEARLRARCGNEDNEAESVDYLDPIGVPGTSRHLPDDVEHIYMSILGDVS